MTVYLKNEVPQHPKMLKLLEHADGDRAAWLWVTGLCWTQEHRAKGAIPRSALPILTRHRRPLSLAGLLVDVGLWDRDGDDYRVHDYEDHNWASTKAANAAKKRWEDERRSAGASPGADARASASADALPIPTPTPTDVVTPPYNSTVVGIDVGGGDTSKGKANGNGLVDRMVSACTARKRKLVEQQAPAVVEHLTRYVDSRLVDEVVGRAAAEKSAVFPTWFLPAVRSRASMAGIDVPPHPELEAAQ